MKSKSKIGIIVTVIVIIAVLGMFANFVWTKNGHRDYCDRWLQNINETQAQLASQWFPNPDDQAQSNAQVDQYNKECYY